MTDPFAVLGVDEDASDETIRQHYLALVRRFPPDREPDRFQEIRQAYEAIRGARERLVMKLLHTSMTALTRVKRDCLRAADAEQSDMNRHRATAATVKALLLDGLQRIPI
jgi:preprotein translocase subunit Sec63